MHFHVFKVGIDGEWLTEVQVERFSVKFARFVRILGFGDLPAEWNTQGPIFNCVANVLLCHKDTDSSRQ